MLAIARAESARAPARLMWLSRTVGVCPFTVRRRVNALIERGLVEAEPDRRFKITDKGRALLGPDAAPARWVDLDKVRASLGKDVIERQGHHPNDDRTRQQRSEHSHEARLKSAETMRANKTAFHFGMAG